MRLKSPSAALLALFLSNVLGQQTFTISNGQIFTPGFAVVDSPQPGTPLGGDTIEVALDVTADGVLPLDVAPDSPSRINNITIFMYSYETGRNFTISNGTTATGTNGPIMEQESGSTVKHVRWTWPSCLVGDGQPSAADSDRGEYNVSIRQNFVLNDTAHYTVFDLPISVTNSISGSGARPDCDSLNNALWTPEQIDAAAANSVGILFAPGDARVVQVKSGRDPSAGGRGIDSTTETLGSVSGALGSAAEALSCTSSGLLVFALALTTSLLL